MLLSSYIVNWTYITGGRALRVLLMRLRYLITKERSLKDHIAHCVTFGFSFFFFFLPSFPFPPDYGYFTGTD